MRGLKGGEFNNCDDATIALLIVQQCIENGAGCRIRTRGPLITNCL